MLPGGGAVYVSDSDNHRVQVFTPDGGFIAKFGAIGTAPGQFTIPFDLGADADGSLYVTDDGLMRLTKFSRAGIRCGRSTARQTIGSMATSTARSSTARAGWSWSTTTGAW
jgi:DNA-binding beta-propeller fold protein YncE